MIKPLQPPCGRGNAFSPLWWLAPPPKGGGERSEPIRRMLFMLYDIESQSRNAAFMFIARKGDTTTLGPKGR
ncbi:hypothetical protein, partial [Dialister succinatiphilus]|uniref:hypothetical protein n=1 Tax=Dialister succinatiphilus TaxID=487173 RepID=UPI003F7FC3EF